MGNFPARSNVAAVATACDGCKKPFARAVSFCPYCGFCIEPPAPAVINPIITDTNVIHGVFDRAPPDEAKAEEPAAVPSVAARPAAQVVPTERARPEARAEAARRVVEKVKAPPAPRNASQPAQPLKPAIRKRRPGRVALVVAGVLTVAAIIARQGGSPTNPPPVPSPAASPVVMYVVRADAAVRAKPSVSAQLVATAQRGTQLEGTWETRPGSSHKWLQISVGQYKGDWIWDRNLSDQLPPPITLAVNDYMLTKHVAVIYGKPSTTAAQLATVGQGTRLFVVGEIGGNWLEVAMKHGGVGYVSEAALR